MLRSFVLAIPIVFLAAVPAGAQAVATCSGSEPPARDLRAIGNVAVVADSAFLELAGDPRDVGSARFRVRVSPAGAAEVVCVYPGASGSLDRQASAMRALRFTRGYRRPFRDTATVEVSVATSRAAGDAPVHEVRRLVSVGQGVRVEVAAVAAEPGGTRFSAADELAIYRAAVDEVLSRHPRHPGVRCVVFVRGGGPAEAVAAALDRPGMRVVAGDACPPERSDRASALRAELMPLHAWSPTAAALTLTAVMSAYREGFTCVMAQAGAGWRPECRSEGVRIVPGGTGRARL